uniref:Uncharacterized protein n=1 Tax=Romanomermis culicivorax TaxID=13658 RepID=A0A915KV01_ROMCU
MSAPLVVQLVDLHGDFPMQLAINRVPNIPHAWKLTYRRYNQLVSGLSGTIGIEKRSPFGTAISNKAYDKQYNDIIITKG